MISEQSGTLAKVSAAGLTLTKGGKEQVSISFDLLDGPDAGQGIGHFGSMSDAAMPYTLKNLRTLGWKDGAELETIVGAECKLTIAWEEYEGKTSPRVKWINSLAPAFDMLPPAERVNAMAKLNAAARAAPVVPSGPLSPEPPYNDPADLPF